MKSKDKSSEKKIRQCERHKSQFILEYHFYEIIYTISEKKTKKKLKFRLLRFLKVLKT